MAERKIENVGDCYDVFAEAGLPKPIVTGPASHTLFPAARGVAKLLDERDALRARVAEVERERDAARLAIRTIRDAMRCAPGADPAEVAERLGAVADVAESALRCEDASDLVAIVDGPLRDAVEALAALEIRALPLDADAGEESER